MSGRVGVWLDTPLLDVEHGPGTVEKHFPAMMLQFERFGIDISKDPVLIYPTLHYQNGGVKIDTNAETNVKNLFVAGEASGGLHGRNRLMGNSFARSDGVRQAVGTDGSLASGFDAARQADSQTSGALPHRSQKAREPQRGHFPHDPSGLYTKGGIGPGRDISCARATRHARVIVCTN